MAEDLRQLPPSGHTRARGLVSSRRSGSRIDAKTFAPPDSLADVVESFWVGRWDLPDHDPHVTELLGDPCVHVVAERGHSRVVGVWTRRWVNRLQGKGFVRAVKLRPGAVRAFFSCSASTLTDTLGPLDALDGAPRSDAFEATILDPESDAEAFAHFRDILEGLRRHDDDDEMHHAIAIAEQLRDPSLCTVNGLAPSAGMNIRALQRLFKNHVGAPPKTLLCRVRLQEAALAIEKGEVPNFARLAVDLGYTDQAHLSRDFRIAVGVTPKELQLRFNNDNNNNNNNNA
ncbi:MAG: helix-turn-helix transcriptional regulator [Nannocystaceae bacterium]